MKTPVIAAIAAMSQNRVMGIDNKLPWHIPGDLKFFKSRTMGKPLIMGRKTFQSLGRPLPGRTNIIVSRNADFAGADIVHATSLEDAIEKARVIAMRDRVDEIMIGGGAQIYESAMNFIERIYLTVIERDYEGDTWFPPLPDHVWTCVKDDPQEGDPPYRFQIFERKR